MNAKTANGFTPIMLARNGGALGLCRTWPCFVYSAQSYRVARQPQIGVPCVCLSMVSEHAGVERWVDATGAGRDMGVLSGAGFDAVIGHLHLAGADD